MTVEVSTYISQLNSALPAVGDLKSEGDEHIRKIKANLLATFPNLTAAAVTASTTELNYVDGVTSNIQTQLDAKASITYVDTEIADALGAGATWTQSGTGAVARTIQATFRDSVSVKDFGATGDGVTDDTAAIQLAFDTGYDITFPDGTYKVTSQLTIDTAGQQVTGNHPYPNEFGGAAISFTHDGVCILVQQAQCAITNMRFVGTAATVDTAIKAAKATNTDDIDIAVTNCFFKTCTIGINTIGRSLNASENLFANCDTCITLSWPTSGTSGTGEQALPLGFRATRIIDNRAHSCALFVETTGTDNQYFRGAVISGNQLDIGEQFFSGGIIDSTISNNVVEMSSGTILYVSAGGSELTISGNVFNGTSGDATQSPARAIWFDTGSTPTNLTITGNSISYMDTDCLRFVPAASYVTISGNYFGEAGSKSIDIDTSLTNSSIVGNVFNPGTGLTCIDATGATVTDCVIYGNGYASTKTLLGGSPTDGGGNILQTVGKVHFGSLTAPSRSVEASTTSSLAARFTRTGSAGGVGFDFINTAGTINLFVTPTGANAGSFVPGGDNTITNGSASFRWSVVYAGTGTINTSDARSKQQIRSLTDAEKAVALKCKSLIKAFKFNDAVEAKGSAARIHFGVIAQEVVEAFASEGLDASDYALLCYDEWEATEDTPAGNRYGVRYEELLAFVISSL